MANNLPPPPTGPTFDWRVFKDWFYKLWLTVTGTTFGNNPQNYSAAISRFAAGDDRGASLGFNEGKPYLYPAAGAVYRTVQDKQNDWVDVRDFGAKGDGSTDNTSSMNAAHATGLPVYYPPGTWNFTFLNPITSGGIIGAGRTATQLVSTDTGSSSLITFNNSNYTPIFKDFLLRAPSSGNLPVKTGGAGILLNPSTGEIDYSNFSNVTIAFVPTCISFVAAAYWTMNNCEMLGYNFAGIQVNNTNNADSGDSVIQGCLFNTPATTGPGIIYYASGGLKVFGSKFLGGQNALSMQFTGTTNTSDLLFIGNSSENMSQQDISLSRTSGVNHFSNIVIVGNQFAVGNTGIQTDASNFINEMTITGNVFNLSSGAGSGINLATITDFVVGANSIKGNGGTPTGVIIAASCTNGKILPNSYATLTTTLSNSSTTTFVTKDVQEGTTTTAAAGWAGYGNLFSSPSTTVTFGTAFTVAPIAADIQMCCTSTNGVVSYLVTGVSTTTFTYIAISSVTNIAASFAYQARGII